MMLSILSGSLIDVLVPSFVSSSSADRKGISRLSSCVSASFWIGLFIYLFLRKVLAGVAKTLLNLYRRPRGMIAQIEQGAERFSEKSETRVKKLWAQPAALPHFANLTAVEHRRAVRHKVALSVRFRS